MKFNKKGNLGILYSSIVTLGAIAILIGMVYLVLGTLMNVTATTITANATAVAGINTTQTAITTIVNFLPIIAIAIVAGIVLSIVIGFFAGRRSKGP